MKEIRALGEHKTINLEGSNAIRKELEKALVKGNTRLVVFNGHGTKEYIYGHNDEIILDESNTGLLKSKIIYAVACDSLRELGENAVKQGGADSFIGYESQFMIVIDPTRTTAPDKDRNAKPFEQVYVMFVIALLSGLSVEDSIEKTKELIRKLIREYGVFGIRDKYGDAPLIRWALFWDLYFLSAHGDLDTVF